MEYGYVRVSTKEQNEDRQVVIAMREFGIEDGNIMSTPTRSMRVC